MPEKKKKQDQIKAKAESAHQKGHVCVIIDYIIKWCEAFPLKLRVQMRWQSVKLFNKFGASK